MNTMQPILDKWEVKDRTYLLKSRNKPLTLRINTTNVTLFDEDKKINRRVRYAPNQDSLFVDEQAGVVRLEHVYFQDGVLHVPKDKPNLQILMSLLHPSVNQKWFELDHEKDAEDELAIMEKEMEATTLASSLEIEHLEAIMRTEFGSAVAGMSTKELKRDSYIFARKNPKLFTDLANDEDLKLRNLANRVVEMKLLKLTDDNTVFNYVANGHKLFTVPFGENPYAALAQYFKTDKGSDQMSALIKKLE